jgi:hypothetical protein
LGNFIRDKLLLKYDSFSKKEVKDDVLYKKIYSYKKVFVIYYDNTKTLRNNLCNYFSNKLIKLYNQNQVSGYVVEYLGIVQNKGKGRYIKQIEMVDEIGYLYWKLNPVLYSYFNSLKFSVKDEFERIYHWDSGYVLSDF